MRLAELQSLARKRSTARPSTVRPRPIQPRYLRFLAIGVVVALLSASELVAGEQHWRAVAQKHTSPAWPADAEARMARID